MDLHATEPLLRLFHPASQARPLRTTLLTPRTADRPALMLIPLAKPTTGAGSGDRGPQSDSPISWLAASDFDATVRYDIADMDFLVLTIGGGPSPDSHSDTSAEHAGLGPRGGRSPASISAGHDLRITECSPHLVRKRLGFNL